MFKRVFIKHAGFLAGILTIVGMISTSTQCRFFGHQPEEPENLSEQLKLH